MTDVEQTETAHIDTSIVTNSIGTRLDNDHAPQTNGRMAVCRRCGARTDGPQGGHSSNEKEFIRADDWLRKQDVAARIARLKVGRNT